VFLGAEWAPGTALTLSISLSKQTKILLFCFHIMDIFYLLKLWSQTSCNSVDAGCSDWSRTIPGAMKPVTALAVLFAAGSSHHVQACTCKGQTLGLIDNMTVIHNNLRQKYQTHSQPNYVTLPPTTPLFRCWSKKRILSFMRLIQYTPLHCALPATSITLWNFSTYICSTKHRLLHPQLPAM